MTTIREFLGSKAGLVVCLVIAAVGVYLLWTHTGHVLYALPYLFLLACPLMHFSDMGTGIDTITSGRANRADCGIPRAAAGELNDDGQLDVDDKLWTCSLDLLGWNGRSRSLSRRTVLPSGRLFTFLVAACFRLIGLWVFAFSDWVAKRTS